MEKEMIIISKMQTIKLLIEACHYFDLEIKVKNKNPGKKPEYE